MALLKILRYPDPRLHEKAQPVSDITPELLRLADDMAETMYAAPGVGLAATQVGAPVRLIVLDCAPRGAAPELVTAFNPEIVWREGECSEEEGCLSVPAYVARVTRAERVRVRYLDRDGQTVEREDAGLWSICFQHEIDHLDGILYVDRLSSLKKSFFRKRYPRILAELEEAL